MEEWSRWEKKRDWEGMNSEVLALIFNRLPLEELVGNLTSVCRSWKEVIQSSYCWEIIDMENWCRKVHNHNPQLIDNALRTVLQWSNGACRELSVYHIRNNRLFPIIARETGKRLQTLKMPMSEVKSLVVENSACLFVRLRVLDISFCDNIGAAAISAIGRSCPQLSELKRNLQPFLEERADDGEAMAVGETMPRLLKLVMAYGRFGDRGLGAIVDGCCNLVYLDVQGCWNVGNGTGMVEESVWEKCERILEFKSPLDVIEEEDDEEEETYNEDEDSRGE